MIVKMSDVAILVYSPVLRAATASAEAVKTAINKSIQPKRRPRNISHLFLYLSDKRIGFILKKIIKKKTKTDIFRNE